MPVYRTAHRPAAAPEDIPYTSLSQTLTRDNPIRAITPTSLLHERATAYEATRPSAEKKT